MATLNVDDRVYKGGYAWWRWRRPFFNTADDDVDQPIDKDALEGAGKAEQEDLNNFHLFFPFWLLICRIIITMVQSRDSQSNNWHQSQQSRVNKEDEE